MINTRAKGNRIQLKFIEHLKEEGWLVGKVEQTGKFVKEKDLFGLFDLAGINPSRILLAQVTCNRPHTHEDYIKFSKTYPVRKLVIMQGVWYDHKGWKIFTYYNGRKYVRDLRKGKQ
jgi:hypothetical protein